MAPHPPNTWRQGGIIKMSESTKTEKTQESVTPVPHHISGHLDVLTEHVNAHIWYYSKLPWVLGSMGVLLLLRYAPLRQFRQVSHIPKELVAANSKLSGVVATTGWNAVGVWHVPTWRWVLRWGTRPPSESCFV